MRLFWFGHSCFLFEGEIDNITVLIDPFSGIGLPAPEGIKPDIGLTTHSHFDHNAFGRIRCRKIYHEAKGRLDTAIPITGFELSHDEMDGKKRGKITAYSIVIDGIRIIHLGDLGTTLGSEDIERLQNPDVLLVPVGGIFTLNGKTAVEVIKQLKPRIAIPMHYKVKGLLMDIDTVDMFLSEMEKSGLNTVIEKMNKNYIFLSLADMDTNTIKIMVLGEEFQPYKPIDSSILRPETLAEPHPSETVNERITYPAMQLEKSVIDSKNSNEVLKDVEKITPQDTIDSLLEKQGLEVSKAIENKIDNKIDDDGSKELPSLPEPPDFKLIDNPLMPAKSEDIITSSRDSVPTETVPEPPPFLPPPPSIQTTEELQPPPLPLPDIPPIPPYISQMDSTEDEKLFDEEQEDKKIIPPPPSPPEPPELLENPKESIDSMELSYIPPSPTEKPNTLDKDISDEKKDGKREL